MSTYNSDGITVDRYPEIVARYIALCKAQWGESINTDEDEFLGHTIRNTALIQAEMNEIVQALYDAISVANATGAPLDNLVALVGLFRQSEAFSTVTMSLTSVIATTVPVGSQYGTDAGVIFATDEELVFSGADTLTVDATCTVMGPNEAGAGEVKNILTPVHGITVATNAAAAIPGRLRETDAQVKVKHTAAVATSGEDDLASVYEALAAIDGVSAIYTAENDTNETVNGVPAHNIHVSVIGGSDDDVAEAICHNKTSGVPTHGAQSVTVYNETTSQAKEIHFDRAANVPIYIQVTVTKESGIYPDDGDAQMKAALVASFVDKRIAADVIFTELYAPIYSVTGHFVTDLQLSKSPLPVGTSDLSFTTLERATLAEADIDILETS